MRRLRGSLKGKKDIDKKNGEMLKGKNMQKKPKQREENPETKEALNRWLVQKVLMNSH